MYLIEIVRDFQLLIINLNFLAGPDLKKALEVCEFAMKVTNGEVPNDVVPIATRYPLLQTWVYTKQMLQQQVYCYFVCVSSNDIACRANL